MNDIKYIINKHNEVAESFAYWENAFNSDELDYLQRIASSATQDGLVGLDKGNSNGDIRRSQVRWIDVTAEHKWIYDKLAFVVAELNSQFFHFDITGFGEALQLTNYNGAQQGTYKWHQDAGGKISRKLSLVLQLSDPSEYEGGNLQFFRGDDPVSVPKKRGFIVVFPSWLMHQVTPVTQGTRQSLVSWITGPSFR